MPVNLLESELGNLIFFLFGRQPCGTPTRPSARICSGLPGVIYAIVGEMYVVCAHGSRLIKKYIFPKAGIAGAVSIDIVMMGPFHYKVYVHAFHLAPKDLYKVSQRKFYLLLKYRHFGTPSILINV